MSTSEKTLIERELRLVKIPAFPLALSIALVLAIFYLVIAMVGKVEQLRQQAQSNEVPLTTLGVLQDLWFVGGVSAVGGFFYGFIPVWLAGLVANAILKLIGGVRFVVAEPKAPPPVI